MFLFFFLSQNTNVRVYLEVWGKQKQDPTVKHTLKGDQVLSGEEPRKPEDVIDVSLTELLSGTNKPPPSCLPLPSIP